MKHNLVLLLLMPLLSCSVLSRVDDSLEYSLSVKINDSLGTNIFCRGQESERQFYKYIFEDIGLFKSNCRFNTDSLFIVESCEAITMYISIVSIPEDIIRTYTLTKWGYKKTKPNGKRVCATYNVADVTNNVTVKETSYTDGVKKAYSHDDFHVCRIVEKARKSILPNLVFEQLTGATDMHGIQYGLTILDKNNGLWDITYAKSIGLPFFPY